MRNERYSSYQNILRSKKEQGTAYVVAKEEGREAIMSCDSCLCAVFIGKEREALSTWMRGAGRMSLGFGGRETLLPESSR